MRKKQLTEVKKMMYLATAQVLCEYGKFKSIVEALDWMEAWRRKKKISRPAGGNSIPPGKLDSKKPETINFSTMLTNRTKVINNAD